MTVKELCFFSEGFREPVVGVNRYGWKVAISLLSRLCKEYTYLERSSKAFTAETIDCDSDMQTPHCVAI